MIDIPSLSAIEKDNEKIILKSLKDLSKVFGKPKPQPEKYCDRCGHCISKCVCNIINLTEEDFSRGVKCNEERK